MERRLPKPSTTAYQQWTPTPARRHSDGTSPGSDVSPITVHYGHDIAPTSCRPQSTATPAFPHRTPPPARCHDGGMPLERRLHNRPTGVPTWTPPPPSRCPRLARMERRLPKPPTTVIPHRTPPPVRCHVGGVPPEQRLLNKRPLRRTNMDATSGALP
ncbi:hypothetical protein WOLCODRAFT_154382 [Wolfiporia cocos MD-104 SS10]|uniref:Uncharacterized protein n=1 Tax=Wolfiporia cocos (strain MD-104) TaxID=742152 RepID=A0A2H3JQB7_WOLCO|nr:hypothetical protein WOLCODRAFT_154382 [Wolfiporia cocos MD-104 SS10]